MKTRKLLLPLVLVVMLIISITGVNYSNAFAAEKALDEADQCLIDTFELMCEDGMVLRNYQRQELYDYSLEHSGYAYTIQVSGNTGYALMINRAAYYEVTEMYFDKGLPYEDIEGLPVYLTPMSYIEYSNGQYTDIESGEILGEELLHELSERGFGFNGGTPGQTVFETVTYTSRSVEEASIPGKIPVYFNFNSAVTNACAVMAGSVLVGFYSRYYPELTPGFVVGRVLGSSYTYYNQGSPSKIQGVIDDLYVRMGTNVGGSGTTAAGFRNGLSSHLSAKGRTITYSNVVSNNVLDYNSFKGHIANAKPVALFFNTFNLMPDPNIITSGTTDTLKVLYYGGMHVMISFGYKKVMYYNGSTNFRTDCYVRVGTGFMDMDFGYIKLYDGAIVQEGYAISVA